jgi:glutathione S-transferase
VRATEDSKNRQLRMFMIGPHWGLPSMSPFGIKLATWLRIAGLPHELHIENDPRKGPKRKSPWIVEGSRALGDTELIIAHLSRTRGLDLDAGLDERERAIGLLLRRTFEEHFHQVLEYALFVLDQGWAHSHVHFDFLPPIVRPLLKTIIRSGCRKEGLVRGVTRHDPQDIAAMAADDLRATATLLGDKPYLFGDRPTTTDCTVFAFLSHTLWAPISYFAQDELKRHTRLVEYCERLRAELFPEPVVEGPWQPSTKVTPEARVGHCAPDEAAAPAAKAGSASRFSPAS